LFKHLFSKNKFSKFTKDILLIEDSLKTLDDQELIDYAFLQAKNIKNVFAAIREASLRTLNKRPFDVQLIGAKTIIDGSIAEMKTGEGKTLTAAIAAVYNALNGIKTYVVTVNDYLVVRDSEENKPLFDFFNLTVGHIVSSENDRDIKKEAYSKDIVYGTNSEFGFDFLRDNMVYDINDKVQIDKDFVLIDEIDSILIDEARTPLIISGFSNHKQIDLYMIDVLTKTLIEGAEYVDENFVKTTTFDFILDRKQNSVYLTEAGVLKIENFFQLENLYLNHDTSHLAHIIEQSLVANYIYESGKQYIVKDGVLVLIDESTGRLVEGRQLSNGLHQAIEAKEKINISISTSVLAEITYQNYFKLFSSIGGMTGTAITEAREFYDIYGLDVVKIPTNKPLIREDKKDYLFLSKSGKINFLLKTVKEAHAIGRPILIGTTSVSDNELLEYYLKKENLVFNVLNAKNVELESYIISHAGEFGAITLTTNMAGRGVDIKLDDKSKEVGGLFVIGFERYENRRIDQQLSGRAGRQGDPGTSIFLVSMEDNLIKFFAGKKLLNIVRNMDIDESEVLESKMISNGVENAQKKLETLAFDRRKELVKYDKIISLHRNEIFKIRDSILAEDFDFFSKIADLISLSVNITFEKDDVLSYIYDVFGISFKEKPDNKQFHTFLSKTILNNLSCFISDEEKIDFLRNIYLDILDAAWIEHLTSLEELRQGVSLRQINQKDPLIEFNKDAFHMYNLLISEIQTKIIRFLVHVKISVKEES
jgi:preprotein translocase subunit SecA